MKIYLVGGAVRDIILGKKPHDKDYVVVGSTPREMLDLGYKQVGNEFPVFLHPETGEEYALARKEISTGKGYDDFKFDFNPNITLREDLERRDFTMNALAMDEKGNVIDYFHGQDDIKNQVIRYVNKEHFIEDPLRVLRACRFASQLDFMIDEPTIRLCRNMAKLKMIEHLTEERVWKEIEKALYTSNFDLFLHYLNVCNAIQVILPEVSILTEVPEPLEYHPEGNTYLHTILALKQVKGNTRIDSKERALVNFGVMCHDLGKQLTENWPHHHNHETLGLEIVDKMCDRLKVPNDFRDFGKLAVRYHMDFYKFLDMNVKTQYDMMEHITKFKDNYKLNLLMNVHVCDLFGKARIIPDEDFQYCAKVITRMNLIYTILHNIGLKDLPLETQEHLSKFKGEKFGKLYRDAKISYLKGHLRKNNE